MKKENVGWKGSRKEMLRTDVSCRHSWGDFVGDGYSIALTDICVSYEESTRFTSNLLGMESSFFRWAQVKILNLIWVVGFFDCILGLKNIFCRSSIAGVKCREGCMGLEVVFVLKMSKKSIRSEFLWEASYRKLSNILMTRKTIFFIWLQMISEGAKFSFIIRGHLITICKMFVR